MRMCLGVTIKLWTPAIEHVEKRRTSVWNKLLEMSSAGKHYNEMTELRRIKHRLVRFIYGNRAFKRFKS
jgi:hypothetical protein